MLELGKPNWARVLKIDSGKAILGVYADGMWRRVTARVYNVDLQEKERIRGTLQHRTIQPICLHWPKAMKPKKAVPLQYDQENPPQLVEKGEGAQVERILARS